MKLPTHPLAGLACAKGLTVQAGRRDSGKAVYQRRVSGIARLLSLQWTCLLDPPGWLLATDDGTLLYEACYPSEEGQSWQEAHFGRADTTKSSHGIRNIFRDFRCACPCMLCSPHAPCHVQPGHTHKYD